MSNILLGNILTVIAYIFLWAVKALPKKWMMILSEFISTVFFVLALFALDSMAGVCSEIILCLFLILTLIKTLILNNRPFVRKPNKYYDKIIDNTLNVCMYILLALQLFNIVFNYESYGTIFLFICNGIGILGDWYCNEQQIRWVGVIRAISYGIYAYTILNYSAIAFECVELIVCLAMIMTYGNLAKKNKQN